MTFRSWLLPSTISESMVLLQPESVLLFMPCVANKGHTDTYDLGLNLWPCWYLRAVLLLGPNRHELHVLSLETRVAYGLELWSQPCLGLWPCCRQDLC